jgi:tetratricopeptide (TPR) repeat protein
MNRLALWVLVGSLFSPLAVGGNFDEVYQQGERRLAEEQYGLAVMDFAEAQGLANTPEEKAQSSGMLGIVYYRMQRWEKATQFLRAAIALHVGKEADRSRWLGTLADLEADRGKIELAKPLYEEALALVGQHPELIAGLTLGKTDTLPQGDKLPVLMKVKGMLPQVEDPQKQASLWIALGIQAHKLGEGALSLAFESFQEGKQLASPYFV